MITSLHDMTVVRVRKADRMIEEKDAAEEALAGTTFGPCSWIQPSGEEEERDKIGGRMNEVEVVFTSKVARNTLGTFAKMGRRMYLCWGELSRQVAGTNMSARAYVRSQDE